MLSSVLRTTTSKLLPKHVLPSASSQTVRYLNLHEYISMEIMNQYNISTPKSYAATSADEAEHIYETKMTSGKFI